MQEHEFQRYMLGRNLADKTRQQRIYGLKRVERAHGIDLDKEFERDGLDSLAAMFRYSAQDARADRPNPTRMDIDPDKLPTQLPWYLVHIQDYRRFKEGAGEAEDIRPSPEEVAAEQIVTEAISQTFGLERDLQTALRASISQLEDGMVIADNGSEVHVEAGFIDILAKDRDGIWTIIELKVGLSRPAAVAQLLAYMGCIEQEKAQPVRGILIAAEHDNRVVLAARAVANLELRTYRHRFEFE